VFFYDNSREIHIKLAFGCVILEKEGEAEESVGIGRIFVFEKTLSF